MLGSRTKEAQGKGLYRYGFSLIKLSIVLRYEINLKRTNL